MPNFPRILTALYGRPWLIAPVVHRHLCEIVAAHIDGSAHAADGIANAEHERMHGATSAAPNAREWWHGMDGQPNGVSFADGVAIFDVCGVIGRRFSSFLNSSGVTSVDVLTRMLDAAREDERVTGVVLDMDTPGGTVTGVPEAASAVAKVASEKPVVAFVGGMCASAGYWLAAPADEIIAAPSAETGSIGVYSYFLDQSRAYEMEGFKVEIFKTGKYKGAGMPGLPLSDDQKERIQSEVDEVFGWFKSAVFVNRPGVPDEAMQGQTFFAADALRMNLIDRTGTIEDAIESASKTRS